MATDRRIVKSYFTEAEHDHLKALCNRLGLGNAELIRRLVMGQSLPDADRRHQLQEVRDLLKVNADQARLGNLLKLALDSEPPQQLTATLNRLCDDIRRTQQVIKDTATQIFEATRRSPRP